MTINVVNIWAIVKTICGPLIIHPKIDFKAMGSFGFPLIIFLIMKL